MSDTIRQHAEAIIAAIGTYGDERRIIDRHARAIIEELNENDGHLHLYGRMDLLPTDEYE